MLLLLTLTLYTTIFIISASYLALAIPHLLLRAAIETLGGGSGVGGKEPLPPTAAPAVDLARRQTDRTPGCNPLFTPANCGACHYWRHCLTEEGDWVVPW